MGSVSAAGSYGVSAQIGFWVVRSSGRFRVPPVLLGLLFGIPPGLAYCWFPSKPPSGSQFPVL